MAQCVLIYGKSGSGKSRSLKNFAEDEILLINVERKLLPFRKKFKYVLETDSVSVIKAQLKKMPLKTAIIDDAGYILTNTFMKGHRSNKGNAVYELYNDIADTFWALFKFIKTELPKDVIVYIIMHEDVSDNTGAVKLKTIGKLLDEKVCLEGMVTVCLRCITNEGKHCFRTVTDGADITKAPEEMFVSEEIDNDLKFVDTTIREYYGFNEEETKNDKT